MLGSDQKIQTIFMTSYKEVPFEFFRTNVVDYLPKPLEPKRLKIAIEKAKRWKRYVEQQIQIKELLTSLRNTEKEKLAIYSLEGIVFLGIDKIVHVQGSGNYSTFYIEDGEEIVSSKNLRHYESRLPELSFFRSHQSHLVNIHFIKKILRREGNMIVLNEGVEIPVARKRRDGLVSLLSKSFCF